MGSLQLLTDDERTFENGQGRWGGYVYPAVRDSVVFHGGHESYSCTALAAPYGGLYNGFIINNVIPVPAGVTSILFSGWVKANKTGHQINLSMGVAGASSVAGSITSNGAWQLFTVAIDVANAATATLIVYDASSGAGDLIWMDDLSLVASGPTLVPPAQTGLTSTIPLAIDALIAKCQAIATANPALNLTVGDGQSPLNMTDNVYVVGYEVGNWMSKPAGLGNLRRNEEYVIKCVALSHNGGDGNYESSPVRAQVFQLIELVVQQLSADPQLGNTVRFAEVIGSDGGITRQGVSSIGGWSVEVEFGVRCTASVTL